MTPESIFAEVADTLFMRVAVPLHKVLLPMLRQFPSVWESCVAISTAANNNDKEGVEDELRKLDLLVGNTGWDYNFEDLQYRLVSDM